jgi:nucleoside permease NupC
MNLLLVPYIVNIVILVPVALGTLTGLLPISRGHFPESAGWRTLTGSLWIAILVCSIAGLFYPVIFAPILLLQVIYKLVWIIFYVLPRLKTEESRKEIHWGITISFLLIVIFYPIFIPWCVLFPK